MNQHFVITLDRGHLKIYREITAPGQTPHLEVVNAMDFPQGRRSYTDRDTDQAGRFQSSKRQAGGASAPGSGPSGRTGMSIDERLPMKEEEERRSVQTLSSELEGFLRSRPDATWDFAAPASLYNAVIGELSPDTRNRMKRSLSKDLVNQSSEEVRAHFAAAGR
jgi:hypothetical protein